MHNFGPASKQKNLVESNDEILNWVNCLELLETSFYKIKTLYFARIKLGLNQSQHISSQSTTEKSSVKIECSRNIVTRV